MDNILFRLIFSVMGHMLVYFFEEKRKSLSLIKYHEETLMTEVDIANIHFKSKALIKKFLNMFYKQN